MRFILPTQNAPMQCISVGNVKLLPYKRVALPFVQGGMLHLDSMSVECSTKDWVNINEWIAFHAIIFDDTDALDWYESDNFNSSNNPDIVGDCARLVDYENISKNIYWTREHKVPLTYAGLYDQYISKPGKDNALIKTYLSCGNRDIYRSQDRAIRDMSFWRFVALFSIVEVIVGKPTRCTSIPKCNICKDGKKREHKIAQQDWLLKRLGEIVKDVERSKEYFTVIWLVREKIRHKTVHESASSKALITIQRDRTTIYDLKKIKEEWEDNFFAQQGLETSMREITRLLLLDSIFSMGFFPQLPTLNTTRIDSPSFEHR